MLDRAAARVGQPGLSLGALKRVPVRCTEGPRGPEAKVKSGTGGKKERNKEKEKKKNEKKKEKKEAIRS